MIRLSLVAYIVLTTYAFASQPVAKVIIFKGTAIGTTPDGKKVTLAKGVPVVEGTKIETQDKSFVKLLFTDKSQVNIGPKSEMEITKFPKGEPGMLSVLKGQVRTKVEKDSTADKSKLYVKTKTASMGVRGTDFTVTYNPENQATATITFSGDVRMAQTSPDAPVDYVNFEKIVSAPTAVSIKEGNFSAVNPKLGNSASIPTKLNPAQFNGLKKNENLEESNKKKSETSKYRSIVPPGMSARTFTSKESSIESAVGTKVVEAATAMNIDQAPKEQVSASPPPEGMVDKTTGAVAPPAGGFIDLEKVVYIAPPPGSKFDPNTNTYMPPPTLGNFDPEKGSYQPPENMELTSDGKLVVEESAKDAGIEIKDIVVSVTQTEMVKQIQEMVINEMNSGEVNKELIQEVAATSLPAQDDNLGNPQDTQDANTVFDTIVEESQDIIQDQTPTTTNLTITIKVID